MKTKVAALKKLLAEFNAEWDALFGEESPKKQIKTKKEFIDEKRRKASELREMRRRLERQSSPHQEDISQYFIDSQRYLGEMEGVFDFMGWGDIPKSLTKNIEFSEM